MSNAGIGLRIIQEISGHSNLEQLQHYERGEAGSSAGSIASVSMLSYRGKYLFPALPFSDKSD
jgi:integrase/recombinase XerD